MSRGDEPGVDTPTSAYAKMAGGVARLQEKLDAILRQLEDVRAEADASLWALQGELEGLSTAIAALATTTASAAEAAHMAEAENEAAAGGGARAETTSSAEAVIEKTAAKKTESKKSRAEKPEAEKPQAEKPEVEKPKVETPEVEKPEAEKPQAEKPEAEKPEAEKPEAKEDSFEETAAGSVPTKDVEPQTSDAREAQAGKQATGKPRAEVENAAPESADEAEDAAATVPALQTTSATKAAERAETDTGPAEKGSDAEPGLEAATKEPAVFQSGKPDAATDIAAAMLVEMALDTPRTTSVTEPAVVHGSFKEPAPAVNIVDSATPSTTEGSFEAILEQEFADYFESTPQLQSSAPPAAAAAEEPRKSADDEWA
jgi:hypothetical protein